MYKAKLAEKFEEAVTAVLPIVSIVLLLSMTAAPMPVDILLAFLLCGLLIVVGMMFFTLGAELAMEPIGSHIGSNITRTRNLPFILFIGFVLGFMITISEPDLQVLANQVQSVPNSVLIISVAAGVGIFLVAALLRMLIGVSLRSLLTVLYAAVFLLAYFAPGGFLAVAFDSGGVTTGPMTVPFIMAFGIGISSIRSDRHAANDSFGLISLCSVGPILAVMILSLIYSTDGAAYVPAKMMSAANSLEMSRHFIAEFPHHIKEIAQALLPIAIFFGLFQMISLKLKQSILMRIGVGLLYTYIGLVLFMTGVNAGFMPAGSYLGQTLAGLGFKWIIIPIGMVMGYYIVKAEPAVYVLMKQVEDITNGAVQGVTLQKSLCVSVALSIGIAMIRVLTGMSVMIPVCIGYGVAIIMSFFVPKIFTAIAFDSGGVASGPMTATFLLPFATGACIASGGDVARDAFGVVAMVAMTPLITIQLLGLISQRRERSRISEPVKADPYAGYHDFSVIEL